MAKLWNKIMNIFQAEEDVKQEELDLSVPVDQPLDEKFADLFTKSGGHFLYCENQNQVLDYLSKIIESENISRFICFDEELQSKLNSVGGNYINYPSATADFNFLKCESLIAFNGSVMLSSDVTSCRKLHELSDNFIIYASYKEIVRNTSEALQVINSSKSENLPSGITSIGGVDADAMGGQTSTKNIYLLLVE